MFQCSVGLLPAEDGAGMPSPKCYGTWRGAELEILCVLPVLKNEDWAMKVLKNISSRVMIEYGVGLGETILLKVYDGHQFQQKALWGRVRMKEMGQKKDWWFRSTETADEPTWDAVIGMNG